ncbi:eCIS core domain-containing protein [Streptomyces odontomachi]|uniref:eCIS core domain-containing protein n=1 Tax=Streptomyces odontomachi TaxID=2944940 RepID=UPI00210E9D9B|nr:DUF4157 domain-containing protein [Streptomyces sp. ODS25]
MSTSHTPAQDAREARERRRKRKERATSRATDPKNVVSGAGQPLDPSVRRDLEEQLGHDLSKVRLHTDRDAGALTEMLGADAVAVGQDIFFRAGAFAPGTADGRRLLAHELLHTVQNPHGLGTLRAGRDLGAVSLPHQAIEREAEGAAREIADGARDRAAAAESPAATGEPRVEEGQETPGWLRYATVDANRRRMETVDPATLLDRLANNVLRSLRGDPQDASGRVRLQLARMGPELQDGVLDRLELRLLSTEFDRVLALTTEAERPPLAFVPAETPGELPNLAEQRQDDRVTDAEHAEGTRAAKAQRAEDDRGERRDAGDRDEKAAQQRSRAANDAAEEEREGTARDAQEAARARSSERTEQEQQRGEEQQDEQRQSADEQGRQTAADQQGDVEQQEQDRKEQREREEQDPEQANEPGAPKKQREEAAQRPADGSTPRSVDPKAGVQPGPVRPEKVDERAELPESPLTRHGLNEKDEHEGEPREEELPLGVEAGADGDVPTQENAAGATGVASAEPALRPEDYLPASDLDVSAVPTADQLQPGAPEPALPLFPTPPPTRAEQVEKEREDDASDEDTEDGPQTEAKAPGEERGPVEGEAPQPENGPAADAGDHTARDLETDRSADQEVGPDPETADHEDRAAEDETKAADDHRVEGGEPGDGPSGQADDDKDGATGDGSEDADAKDTQSEEADRKARDEAEAKARPEGAGGPGASGTVTAAPVRSGTAVAEPAAAGPPAGAHTEQTPAEDRHPSPATRRSAEPVRGDREAAGPRSAVPKESGPGAAPSGVVGGPDPAGPTAAAGPGAAPSAAQAAVSPAEEQQGNTGGKLGAPAPEGAKPGEDASLEKDGGGCAPPAPPPEPAGAAGCGGGSGGQSKPEKKKAPPDVSGQDPKAALSTVSKLAPDQAQEALPGVNGAAENKVKKEQQRLSSNPPTRERPSGAPRTQAAPPTAAPPEAAVTGRVERVPPPDQSDKQQAKGSEKAQGAHPTDSAPQPEVSAIGEKELSPEDAQSVEAAADQVPTSDPALRNKTVGPAPKIRLEGASDPKRTDDQAQKLKDKQSKLRETGRADSLKPMGEDKIYPNAPREQLRGKVHAKARTIRRAASGAPPKEGYGVVAQQERGGEIQSAAGQAQSGLATSERQQQQDEQKAKHQKQAEIDRQVDDNAAKQTTERGRAAQDAERQREQWRDEQDKHVDDADKKTKTEHEGKNKEIVKARNDKDKEVEGRKDTDNKSIDDERDKSEKEAKKKKEEKKPSGGFFGWIADKVKSFFSALLDAVTKIFDAARKAVNGIIDKFKEFANKAIDAVRDFAIKAINVLADALIAIGDTLLAAFPSLRDKFRNAINNLRDKAINAVNKLADGLKKAVNALLDALAAGLNALLDVLEAGIKAAIKIYESVIVGALKFVEAAVSAFGQFAELIADIAPDPGGWLSKAGSAAKTGITDHLWGAIKTAVKQWFDEKVQSVIGLGKMIIDVLVKGCMSLKQIGKMAWDAVIAALPMMIIMLVIEKVVSLIIPAAGAILTIIQGLMAAWGTVSRILQAFSKFWAFLKAVKSGPAACLFAEAVAAGVVALLEFIANFLLQRLGRALKGVGKRLQALAQKILKGLKKAGKGARKAAGGAINRARGAARKAAQQVRKPGRPAKPTGSKVPSRPGAGTAHGPAKPKGPATSQDRPSSRTPNREKEHRRDADEAKHARDANDPAKRPDPKSDRAPDRTSEKPSAKKPTKPKETEAPKRTKPSKPKSAAGRALSKAKGAVKGALKKIRNAGRTLGRKLRKSKLGQALKKTGHKLRDFFKKKRDRLRDQHKRRNEQRKRQQEERKKKENSKESKEARLQKIVARIAPKISQLVRRSVPGIILRTALAAMRLWYRLTDLVLSGRSDFEAEAVLNPRRVAGKGFVLTGYDLRRLADEVVKDLMQRGDVRAAELRMRRTKAAVGPDDESHQLEVSQPADIPGAVRYYQGRGDDLETSRPRPQGDPRGDSLDVTLGPHAPKEGTGFATKGTYERHAVGPNREDVVEENLKGISNAKTQVVGDYPGILGQLRATGREDSAIADALHHYTRSGRFPSSFSADERELLAHLHWLMVVRESVRNRTNLAMAPMTLALLRDSERGITWEQAFTAHENNSQREGGRGLFPMSMRGAAAAARDLAARARRKRGKQPYLDMRELKRREVELTELWAASITKGDGIYGSTRSEARKKGRTMIQEFVLKFYGLN